MIRNLRDRHRSIFSVLALALPVAFVAALFMRPAPPPAQPITISPADPISSFTQCIFAEGNLWPQLAITVRVFADAMPPAQLALELEPASALPVPEVLVYWKAGAAAGEGGELRDAFLLGALAGEQPRRWSLPRQATQGDGQLLLYSLAHQTLLGRAPLKLVHLAQKGDAE